MIWQQKDVQQERNCDHLLINHSGRKSNLVVVLVLTSSLGVWCTSVATEGALDLTKAALEALEATEAALVDTLDALGAIVST